MELMKRLTEINGFICESRGRLEELKSDCQNWALDEDGEIVKFETVEFAVHWINERSDESLDEDSWAEYGIHFGEVEEQI